LSWSTDILNYYKWVGNTHFFHGFRLITRQILMICEWEAQIILTRSISYDNLRVLIMVMVYWYFKTKSMVWIHPFFWWHWVNCNSNINDWWMGGPLYLKVGSYDGGFRTFLVSIFVPGYGPFYGTKFHRFFYFLQWLYRVELSPYVIFT